MMANENLVSRRGLLMKLGMLFNGVWPPLWRRRLWVFFCRLLLAAVPTVTCLGFR